MISGWVELRFGGRPGEVAEAVSEAGRRVVAGAGFEVAVVGRETDLVARGDLIVACEGRARFSDSRLSQLVGEQGAAAAWVELLREHGAKGLAKVAGEYAVAYVDVGKARALLACDRFAIRPLCYSFLAGRFAFASRADEVPRQGDHELDPQAIFEYLYFHVIPAPRTIFRGVERLRAAHVVCATAEGTVTEAHWTPRFEEQRPRNMGALEEEFRGLVRNAVLREADGRKVGCYLSGGTDSSTITGMLARFGGSSPRAYSIGFKADGYDEMHYARIAARHFGADHRDYYVTPEDLVQGIPNVAAHYDQPFGNSSALPAYYCARLAASDGIERLLAGDGGDELFGGNSRYAKQRVFEVYGAIPALIRTAVLEPALLAVGLWERVPLVRKAASYVSQAKLPMPDRLESYNLLRRLGVKEVLAPAFRESVDTDLPIRQQRQVYSEVEADLVNSMLAFDWKYTLADNDLPKVCGTANLAGVEVGFPFLSDEILDFSLHLPAEFKVRGLTLRYFFKRALRGFLPEAIIRKQKHGFGLPFGPWLLESPGLFRLASDCLESLVGRGIVRKPFIVELLGPRLREVPGYYGGMVWVLLILEQWLRHRAPAYRV
jgi:asparagine synthase (glutamine-hydrolysing)